MDEIREQIERLRATQLCGGGLELHTEAADTMERLLDVYEAALGTYREFDGLGHGSIYVLEDALSSVQTRREQK